MKLEEFSATVICCMIICFLCSEAKDTICTREYTITDQLTFTVEKTCEWTIKASDSSVILLLTATRLVNNVQLCDTGDIIKVMEDIGGEVATLLQINCSRSYSTERVFSSTAKVKVTARGTAAVVNMTWTEYKKQQFTTSHEDTTWLDAQVGCAVEGGTIVTDENYWLASQSPLRTKCYCLDDRHGFLTLEGYCSYPCPGSLGQMCGGPNTITVYNSEKGDVITSISTIHNDETEGVSKSTIHIDKTEGVSKSTIHIDKTEGVSKSTIHNDETEDASKSTIHIDKTEGAGDDQQGGHPDGNKVALYVPVTVTMCVIVAVAIFIAICLRRKRKQKKAKGKVDEHSYSNTTTEHQAINSLQSHTERELGEYTALYKPQGSVANAKSQDYAVLHQQLEPAHSPDDTEYTEVNPYVNG
ncbi:hypothetical protein MAR_011447 [Mya arenaria]|uniref:WSC domain-containing protein n=1 Tax=Mya arenaria TaxID=6604 RepID=A0ABY7FU50_MYAAR|nr:hypothetical protein MAR_011447 [Mya arenaria]